MKKWIKWIIALTLIAVSAHIILYLIWGPIDYTGTLSTQYKQSDTCQTIITKHFEIETPKDWIHIFHGYGIEGEAWGSFLTKSGNLEYEYGMFSNPFRMDSVFTFSRDSLDVDRFTIYIGENENGNEIGIYIPRQHEMEWPFSFSMNKACSENLDAIISGVKNMRFKRYYFFYPELDIDILQVK